MLTDYLTCPYCGRKINEWAKEEGDIKENKRGSRQKYICQCCQSSFNLYIEIKHCKSLNKDTK